MSSWVIDQARLGVVLDVIKHLYRRYMIDIDIWADMAEKPGIHSTR